MRLYLLGMQQPSPRRQVLALHMQMLTAGLQQRTYKYVAGELTSKLTSASVLTSQHCACFLKVLAALFIAEVQRYQFTACQQVEFATLLASVPPPSNAVGLMVAQPMQQAVHHHHLHSGCSYLRRQSAVWAIFHAALQAAHSIMLTAVSLQVKLQ